ncbi:MAG TPA: RNA polymerase sigma factor [Vicinamibacterales bacterium]|nr:RNA polymerase sigma factor [Vicinamibacterales bacterium]
MDTPTAADLFQRHHLALFRYVYRLTGRRDVAEDVVQEVFVRVVRRLDAYQTMGREAAWLFTIARRLLVDRHRALERRPPPVDDSADASIPAHQETSAALAEALAQVLEVERDAFLLREVGGLSYDEIARLCHTTPDSVRSRIYRARVRLRAMLSPTAQVPS